MNERQFGRTTAQMKAAPSCAMYVWINEKLDYPEALAKKLGRFDLEIVGPSACEPMRLLRHYLREKEGASVVLDHALLLTKAQYDAYLEFDKRIRPWVYEKKP